MPMFRYRFLKYFAEEFEKENLKKPQELTHITTANTFIDKNFSQIEKEFHQASHAT